MKGRSRCVAGRIQARRCKQKGAPARRPCTIGGGEGALVLGTVSDGGQARQERLTGVLPDPVANQGRASSWFPAIAVEGPDRPARELLALELG